MNTYKNMIGEVGYGFGQKKSMNTSWLVLHNCLLNVETLDCKAKKRAGEPEWKNYPKLNVRLDLSAERGRWLEFLDETVQDPDEIEMLQEFCGYCLLGDNRFKKALYVYGPPASGKGVFEDTMANVFGRENVIQSFHGLDLEDRYALIGLFDKTVCFLCEERVAGLSTKVRLV